MTHGSSGGADRPLGQPLGQPLLAGRFALLERLGEGSFAEVWRVRDTQPTSSAPASPASPELLAIKVFKPSARGNPRHPWSVVSDEARASLYLPPHPNVIRAHMLLTVRLFGDEETPALVLDLARGPNLAQWLMQQPRACLETLPDRLAVLGGVLRGLAHVHHAGIAHRDLGFGNILVATEPLTGQIADFGAAAVLRDGAPRPADVRRQEPHALYPSCTPTSDPRQAFGDDVHAMATLCTLVLTERHPLTDQWRDLLDGTWSGRPDPHVHAARRSLLELAPWLARDERMARLSPLLLRCIDRDPERRPQSGAELLREWDDALGPDSDDDCDHAHLTATAPTPGRAPG